MLMSAQKDPVWLGIVALLYGICGASPGEPCLARDSCIVVWLELVILRSKVRGRAGISPEGPCLAVDGCVDV